MSGLSGGNLKDSLKYANIGLAGEEDLEHGGIALFGGCLNHQLKKGNVLAEFGQSAFDPSGVPLSSFCGR